MREAFESKTPAVPDESKTDKQMFRELSLLFHPDQGGDSSLMRELLQANKDAAKGDPAKLHQLYKEWITGGTGEEKVRADIDVKLKQGSAELYEKNRKGGRRSFAEYTLMRLYDSLCRDQNVEPDRAHYIDFLYHEGWITEERAAQLKIKFDLWA